MEKKWVPEIDGKYYYIDEDGTINTYEYDYEGDNTDKYLIKIGNCFKTEEEAQFELEKINFLAKMKEEFEPWKCDWENVNEKKYSLVYYFDGKITKKKWDFSYKTQGAIYTTNEEMIKKYVDNPDTAKYLFEIETIEKEDVIKCLEEITKMIKTSLILIKEEYYINKEKDE